MAQQVSRRNTVRFDLLDELQMDRLTFSRVILQKELGTATCDIDYLFAFPGGKAFEVVFTTISHYERCIERFKAKSTTVPAFKQISLTPLADDTAKTVHVLILSERVRNEDVWTWMSRYCDVQGATEARDADGIKTGERRFQVKLRKEGGLLRHLPNTIRLGAHRGSVYYAGQPKLCRKCGATDHLAATCTATVCSRCRGNHPTAECTVPVQCNLCQSQDHLFKDCPQAYANRLKRSSALVNEDQMGDVPIPAGQEVRDWSEELENLTPAHLEPKNGPEDIPAPHQEDKGAALLTRLEPAEADRRFDEFIGDFPPLPISRTNHDSLGDDIFRSLTDVRTTPPQETPAGSAGKKRPPETSSDGSELAAKVWPPLPLSPSAPFLDMESINSFSILTQIKAVEGEEAKVSKSKKKKTGEEMKM